MNITLGSNPEKDITVITIEISNTQVARDRKLYSTMRYEKKPDKLLHLLGDLAFRMQKGMVK